MRERPTCSSSARAYPAFLPPGRSSRRAIRSSSSRPGTGSAAGWSGGQSSREAGIDLGGQWVGPTQTRILDLATELGVRRFDSYHTGLSTFYWHGVRSTFDGSYPPFEGQPPPVPKVALLDAEQAFAKLVKLSQLVPPAAPWLTPGAGFLDGQTLQTWLQANTRTPFARFVLTQQALIGGSGAFEPGEVSLLHTLFTYRQAPQSENPETDLFFGAARQIPGLSRPGSANPSCSARRSPRSAPAAAA